jgi:hypothetical protein
MEPSPAKDGTLTPFLQEESTMENKEKLIVADILTRLDQTESGLKTRALKSKAKATRYRKTSDTFTEHAQRAADPVLKRLELVEAGNFKLLAKSEETFAARGDQHLAEIADLRRDVLTLLKRSEI